MAGAFFIFDRALAFARLSVWIVGVQWPDDSVIPSFRHLLEEHKPSLPLRVAINVTVTARSLMLKTGIVEDAIFLVARTQRHQGWHRGTAWQSIKPRNRS